MNMSCWQTINEQFPVRKSAAQKAAFRAWVVAEMEAMGYRVKVEVNGRGKYANVVAGDPEHAAVLFTAHYDTPARMLLPNLIIPRNIPLFIAYQVLNVLLLFIPAMAVTLLVGGLTASFQAAYLAWIVTYFALLILMIMGPANPHNANDNTSGVAAVMDLMATLPESARGKVAFILFDDEEKGKLGSKAYAKEHLQVQFTRLTINMDCVGVGEHMICAASDLARRCTGFGSLEKALTETPGCEAHVYGSKTTMANSDQQSFKCGVILIAAKKKKGIGFYAPAIHTAKDTVCDLQNLQYLSDALTKFVLGIVSGGEEKVA